MAYIYICYSQADAQFKDELVESLQAIYLDRHQFWHEQKADADGEVWPGVIEWVGQCDIFMYLLSNEAVASKQCRTEFREAIRLGKRILAVQVRDETRPTGKIGDIQYVDMRNSLDDRQAFERFVQVFNKTIELLPRRNPDPLSSKPISQPETSSSQSHRAGTSAEPGPSDQKRKAGIPAESGPSDQKRKSMPPTSRVWWKDPMLVGVVIGAIALMIVGLMAGSQPTATPEAISSTYEATQVAQVLPASATPIVVPLNTTTPDMFETAQKVLQQQTADALAGTAIMQGALNQTQSAQETQAAVHWTATLTPNTTQTLDAIFTEWAQGTATEQSHSATTTAVAWTATPSETPTLTVPQTIVGPAMTVAPIALTAASILSPDEQMGFIPVTQNTHWVIVERLIDGESMLLVPVGCFTMGSLEGDGDEQPISGQCFERPFWIDKYEVTNRLFWRLGGKAAVPSTWRNLDQPRDNVTWAEAQNFCIQRGARLPTEREWEYAARGPSNLIYPWGNDWNQNNIVWIGSHTAEVGSRPTGSSWVGSLDMAGNISEWVSSLYRSYPYQILDGREGRGALGEQESRIHRGQALTFVGEGDFRSANRIEADVPYSANIGFRCVRSIG